MSLVNETESRLDVLVPNEITPARLITSPIPEPDPARVMPDGTVGEVVWTIGADVTRDARRARTETRRVYRDGVGGVSSTAPENDPIRWFDEGPTNRWALFDAQLSTRTQAPSPSTWVLEPGAATDIEMLGLKNVGEVRVQIHETAGGPLLYDETRSTELYYAEDPHWDFYFSGPGLGNSLSFGDLTINPDSRVTVTISSFDGEPMEIGLLAFGVYEKLGVSQYGFEVTHRNYAYEEVNAWGVEEYRPGLKAKDLRGSAQIALTDANAAEALLSSLLDSGGVFRVTRITELAFMKTWGRLQPATIRPDGPNLATVTIEVRGKT